MTHEKMTIDEAGGSWMHVTYAAFYLTRGRGACIPDSQRDRVKIIAGCIRDHFGGDVAAFLQDAGAYIKSGCGVSG